MFISIVVSFTILFGLSLVGLVIVTCIREDKDRPLVPWGKRMEVERERARTEIHKEHLTQEALEIKRLALDYRRTTMMKAISDDSDVDHVQLLALTQPPIGEAEYQEVKAGRR